MDFHENASGIQTIQKSEMKEAGDFLKLHSQHVCVYAFNDVDFTGFPHGIFGCTPHDMMHCFLEGVLKYATRIFINGFTANLKAKIDLLVDNIFCRYKSSERCYMPHKNFTRGMTNLTKITADKEAEMAFTLLIIAQTDAGQEIFDQRYDVVCTSRKQNIRDEDDDSENDNDDEEKESDDDDDESSQHEVNDKNMPTSRQIVNVSSKTIVTSCTYLNVVEVVEEMLTFHAWYKEK